MLCKCSSTFLMICCWLCWKLAYYPMSDAARHLLEREEKWVYNNLNNNITTIILTTCALISFHFSFLLISSERNVVRDLRWGEGSWVRGFMSCLPHPSALHIKVMLRQSDDTKSLVPMNFVSSWTGWRWWLWRDAFRRLPELNSTVLPTNLPPFVDDTGAHHQKRERKTDPLLWVQGVCVTVVIINLRRH